MILCCSNIATNQDDAPSDMENFKFEPKCMWGAGMAADDGGKKLKEVVDSFCARVQRQK
jgi:hypothetical protein